MFKLNKKIRDQFREILQDELNLLSTHFTLIDKEGKRFWDQEFYITPHKGMKIILNFGSNSDKEETEMFVVEDIYISETGFTGTLKGVIKPLDLEIKR